MLPRMFLMSTSILVILAIYFSPSIKPQNSLIDGIPAFADHGQEITLTLHNSSFGSLTSGGGNQVSVFAEYVLNDNSIAGQTINAVMEVYAPNGTLIRTSSYPDGFVAQGSGGVEGLETTIRDRTLQSVTANVTFRDLTKTEILSNDLRVDLTLAEGVGTSTTPGESVGTENRKKGYLEQVPLSRQVKMKMVKILKEEAEMLMKMEAKKGKIYQAYHLGNQKRT